VRNNEATEKHSAIATRMFGVNFGLIFELLALYELLSIALSGSRWTLSALNCLKLKNYVNAWCFWVSGGVFIAML
jgi:hypothetical protein